MEPHAGTCLACIADDRGRIIRKHARHRREVADVAIDDAEQRDDRGLVGGDVIKVTHSDGVFSGTLMLTLARCHPSTEKECDPDHFLGRSNKLADRPNIAGCMGCY
jgi:hypothetical protein